MKYLLCLGIFITMISIFILAAADVAIDADHFPDENFRCCVLYHCDADDNGFLSDNEISATTDLELLYEEISSLDGIEYFTALTSLDCSENQLTSLNVSKNTTGSALRRRNGEGDCQHERRDRGNQR